jgi:hypothetical protein
MMIKRIKNFYYQRIFKKRHPVEFAKKLGVNMTADIHGCVGGYIYMVM